MNTSVYLDWENQQRYLRGKKICTKNTPQIKSEDNEKIVTTYMSKILIPNTCKYSHKIIRL
jgi:hypothetical protein